METDQVSQHMFPYQLQFDKPLASQVKMAEWNPEKDLLAMVTEDSKVVLHRFNWQRLWTISPGVIDSYQLPDKIGALRDFHNITDDHLDQLGG